MKKIIIFILVAIVSIAVVVGVTLGIQALVKKNTKTDEAFTTKTSVVFDDLQTEDTAYMRAYAVAGDEITKITYQIDTGEEVIISTDRKGKATESWKYYNVTYKDKFYVDSGDMMIDITSLAEGKHIMSVYVYQGDVKECIYESNFKVVKNS